MIDDLWRSDTFWLALMALAGTLLIVLTIVLGRVIRGPQPRPAAPSVPDEEPAGIDPDERQVEEDRLEIEVQDDAPRAQEAEAEVETEEPPMAAYEPVEASPEEEEEVDAVESDEEIDEREPAPAATAVLPLAPEPARDGRWLVVGASLIGRRHVEQGLPCQDHHLLELYDGGRWGIAVVADGAGSAAQAEIGADLACQIGLGELRSLALAHDWPSKPPTAERWGAVSIDFLREVRQGLADYAAESDTPLADLACTFIAVLFTPEVALMTHIGDGRAAYRGEEGSWRPLLTPFKGEEANMTLFLTSESWPADPASLVESRRIDGPLTGIALLSDGCQAAAFQHSVIDPDSGMWSDPNRPFPRFFEPLAETLARKRDEEPAALESQWRHFLAGGNETLRREPDDKTLILGVWLD